MVTAHRACARRSWKAARLAAPLLAVAAAACILPRYLRAAALVVNAAGVQGWPHALASFHAHRVRTEPLRIASRHGELKARLYTPDSPPRCSILLAPGVHAGGLDEPRLVDFAGHLASRGFAALTVEFPDLVRYRITPRTTDMIEDAAAWLASGAGPTPRCVGLVGISFSGGLSIVAAGRPGLRHRIAFVLSLGGHGDLPRVLHGLCTGTLPGGVRARPHDYGIAIALLAVADRIVPPEQVHPLQEGIVAFLEGSCLAGTDKTLGAASFGRAASMQGGMREPSATLMARVNARDVDVLGPLLLPHVAGLADEPALSPERSAAPDAPVYLLHGSDDDVIPAAEARLLAAHLRGRTRVKLLVTPVLRHADVERNPGPLAIWRLISFWASALDERAP